MKKLIYILLLVFVALLYNKGYAQDGAALFKSRCNSCHVIDKNATGPKLSGVSAKWTAAGEDALLFEWVSNSTNLISSGKSTMANAIKGFSPTAMPAQTVSKEEFTAIFNYIDSYVAPQVTTTIDTTLIANVKAPLVDYKENLSIFNWLLFLMVVLICVIIIFSRTIISFIKSDYFKKNQDKNQMSKILLVVIAFGLTLFSNQANALHLVQPGEGVKDIPWLLVEDADIYFVLTLNVILLFVILYLRRLFNQFLSMTQAEKAPIIKPAKVLKKLNKILTDTVSIEEEEAILLHHDYDGIQELDNNLPPWWVWTFYGSIIFGVLYLINYHVLGISELQGQAYETEMALSKKEINIYLKKMAMNVDETNATLLSKKSDLQSGASIFQTNCISCHKEKGQGDVGPNLTDTYWIYGYDIKDLFKTIKKGTTNGMPEHASKLNPIQIQQVASFVLQLPFVKGDKEPNGKIIEK